MLALASFYSPSRKEYALSLLYDPRPRDIGYSCGNTCSNNVDLVEPRAYYCYLSTSARLERIQATLLVRLVASANKLTGREL